MAFENLNEGLKQTREGIKTIFNFKTQKTSEKTPTTNENKKPILDVEFGTNEESYSKKIKVSQWSPDKLVTKKKFEIFDEMLDNDSVIESGISTLKILRNSTGWELKPASNQNEDMKIWEFVKWNLENIDGTFEDDLRELMGALHIGWSLSELVWTVVKNGKYKGLVKIEKIKSKNPKYFNLAVDDYDNLLENGVISISAPTWGQEYPTNKFLIYSYNKQYENIFGRSRIRSLYNLYFLKMVLWRAMGIFCEKYGHPIPTIAGVPLDDAGMITYIKNQLKQFRFETNLVIPSGLELKLHETTGKTSDIYLSIIEKIDKEETRLLLGQTLTSDQSGSYALGKVKYDVLLGYLEELGKDLMKKVVQQQIIKRLVDINFANVNNYPVCEYKSLIEDDAILIIDKYYSGREKGILRLLPEDENKIRGYLKMPLVKEEQILNQSQQFKEQKHILTFAEKSLFTGVRRRTFTEYEKNTDFPEILDILNTGVNTAVPSMTLIIGDAIRDLKEQIISKKIIDDKNSKEVERLQLKYVGEIKEKMFNYFEQNYNLGLRNARQELKNKKSNVRKFAEINIQNINPREALEFFKAKSFTMAGIEKEYILKKVKNVLYNAIKSGATTKDVINSIDEEMSIYFNRGLIGEEALIGSRLETVVRTNLSESFNEGRLAYFRDPEILDFVPAYQYSAIMDDRVRPNHAAMDGRIYSATDSIWDMWTPPNGFNCRCILIPITNYDKYELSSYPPKDILPDAGFKV